MTWFRKDKQPRPGKGAPEVNPEEDRKIALLSWRPYGQMMGDLVDASGIVAENLGPDNPRLPYAEEYLGAMHRVLRHEINLYREGIRQPNLMPMVSPDQPEGTMALIGLQQSAKGTHTMEYGLGPTDIMGRFDETRDYDPQISRLAAEARDTVNAALADIALGCMLPGPNENPPQAA
jgi:hypothetical protein